MTNSFLKQQIQKNTQKVVSGFWSSEALVMVVFAVVVGIGAGLGTLVFVRMIDFFHSLFWDGGKILGLPGRTYIILLPFIGGLIVGPLVHFIAPEAKGHGVPEVLTAIATRGGRIRPVVVLIKALGSAITIGSGGSVGREGPIVQIGAALGSTLGQVFRLSERRVITLLACGAAAGIAATFNAPIAGVMFAAEVILGELGVLNLSSAVVAAVTASVVSQAVLGNSPAFIIPAYSLKSPAELPLYLGLGIVAGFGAILFVKALYFSEDLFEQWKFPPYLKPAVGGLGLGLLGYFVPQVFGTGFDTIADVLTGELGLALLLVLIFAKIFATTLTLGSGASGGVFAPALFVGAVLGGAYGQIAQIMFPGVPASSGAYAMVGMAAVFAGAARAPITAILILFEMTQDYRIILPLMFATVISMMLATWLEPESIYTLKLKLRGIDLLRRKNENLLGSITVQEAMTTENEVLTISASTSLAQLAQMFRKTNHHGFVVIENSRLYGIVTISDLEQAIATENTDTTVGEICTKNVQTVFPDETLDEALRSIGALNIGRVPVVDRGNPKTVIGILRRSDIIQALSKALVERQKNIHHMDRLKMEPIVRAELVEIYIDRDDWVCGKSLREITLPNDCVIVSIQRGKKVVVPRGFTKLMFGDRVIALVGSDKEEAVRAALHQADQIL